MIYNIFVWKYLLFQFQQQIKHWAKPATLSLISDIISDMTRSRSDLILENALLRQQLIVLHRQAKRPMLTQHDRFRLVLVARFSRYWRQAFHIIQSRRYRRDSLLLIPQKYHDREKQIGKHPMESLNSKCTRFAVHLCYQPQI